MGQIEKIMRLLNLLSTRTSVSMKEITRFNRCTTRTVYRHINILSGANIPVYFDNRSQGYRLSREYFGRFVPPEDDILIIITALYAISAKLNDTYKEKIENIVADLMVTQKRLDEEEILALGNISEENNDIDFVEFINMKIIETAIKLNHGITATIKNNDSSTTESVFPNPRLVYDRELMLYNESQAKEERIPLKSILFVKSLKQPIRR